MENPYSVTVKYTQSLDVFADSPEKAILKARTAIGADERKFKNLSFGVKQIPLPTKIKEEKTDQIPFNKKK
jgi:hypothetical protein